MRWIKLYNKLFKDYFNDISKEETPDDKSFYKVDEEILENFTDLNFLMITSLADRLIISDIKPLDLMERNSFHWHLSITS